MTNEQPRHDEGCACCTNGRDEFLREEDARIARFGYTYTAVRGGPEAPGFIYTTGLSERGLPDFIFVGSEDPHCIGYLADAIGHVIAGSEIVPGRIEPGESFSRFEVPIYVVEADDKLETHAYGVSARIERAGSDAKPRLIQIVMPDMQDRFPWEPGYHWLDQRVNAPR